MTNTIVIAEYDPEWPREFERIRAHVLAAFDGHIVTVEHVGSTSVPGLAAKPILDIDVVVPASTDLSAAIETLRALGYAHRGDLGIPGWEAFEQPDAEHMRHHLYLVVAGSPPHREHVDFRDYLRAHPERAARYASLKRTLAVRFVDDREGYTDAKAEFIGDTLSAARGATAPHPSTEALEANDGQRRRLSGVIERAGEDGLRRVVHGEWTVAAKLAHLAYWDRFALALLGRWARGEAYETDGLPSWHDDTVNDALLPEWLALDPDVAARLALEAAEAIDARLRALAREAADRLLADRDAEWLLRRHRHRAEHLDEIEEALRAGS